MAISLEKILTEMEEIKTATKNNIEEFVNSTNTSNLIKESMFTEDDTPDAEGSEIDTDEEVVDTITSDEDDSLESENEVGEEAPDLEVDVEEEEEDVFKDVENQEDPFKDHYDEDGNVDLVNLTKTDPEKALELISKAPEGTTFVKVEVPALEIHVPTITTDDYDGDDTDESELESELEPELEVEDSEDVEELVDESSDILTEEEDVEEINENVENAQVSLLETKISIYEQKLLKLQSLLKESRTENNDLNFKNGEFIKLIKECQTTIKDQFLVNENLKNMSKLMVEHSVSPKLRKEIILNFNNKGTTINESKIIYDMWNKLLVEKTTNNVTKSDILGVEIDGKKDKGLVTETVNKFEKTINSSRIDEDFERLAGLRK